MAFVEAKLITAVVLAVMLSMVGAWLIAWRYRAAMRRLMSAPLPPSAPLPAPSVPPPREAALPGATAPQGPASASHRHRPRQRPRGCSDGPARRAGGRGLGRRQPARRVAADARSRRAVAADLGQHGVARAPGDVPRRVLDPPRRHPRGRADVAGAAGARHRLALVAAAHRRAAAAWFVLASAWRCGARSQPDPVGILAFLAIEIGPPMLLIAALYFGDATRAIAPWLLPLMFGFAFASLVGGELLGLRSSAASTWLVQRHRGHRRDAGLRPCLRAAVARRVVAAARARPRARSRLRAQAPVGARHGARCGLGTLDALPVVGPVARRAGGGAGAAAVRLDRRARAAFGAVWVRSPRAAPPCWSCACSSTTRRSSTSSTP